MNVLHPTARRLACLAGLLSATAAAAHAGTVQLQGSMRTTADLSDRYVFTVPDQVPELVIRLPLPGATDPSLHPSSSGRTYCGDASGSGHLSENESIGGLIVTSSRPTSEERDERDAAGNVYRVLIYKNPAAGRLVVDAQFQRLTMETDLYSPAPRVALPLTDVPDADVPYLQPSKLAESGSPEIQALATRIVAGCETEDGAASAITAWLQSHIVYGGALLPSQVDALATLHSRTSVCEGWADLFIALARAAGLPARFVGGYTLGGAISYPTSIDGSDSVLVTSPALSHAWVELYYPGAGWVPYEPQSSAGFVDTHHVRIWTGVDGQSELPLITWSSYDRWQACQFDEQQSATNVSDDMDLHCAAEADDLSHSLLLSR